MIIPYIQSTATEPTIAVTQVEMSKKSSSG
jgi:hypothetical protein